MKNLFYISLLTVLVVSCKNSNNNPDVEGIIADTISKTIIAEEIIENKTETIIKISEPFKLNTILCYWEHSFILDNDILHGVEMKLKDYKTDKVILESANYVKYEGDFKYKSQNYFDEINKRYFKDINFDGYKDFVNFSSGSMGMTNRTAIYIFNNQTKTFDSVKDAAGEDLSDNYIAEVDSINRILVTRSFDMERVYERRQHFDKKGKIKFSEYITQSSIEISDTIFGVIDYTKIINGKIVETKSDTIKY